MYKEVINLAGAALTLAALTLSGCGMSESEKAADSLVAQAREALDNGDSSRALMLLDSLQAAYPAEVDIQRQGMKLRPLAMEKTVMAQIQSTDSLIAFYADSHQKLAAAMKTIDNADLVEPYMVPADGYDPAFMNSSGVQARVDRAGQFYLVSSLNPGGVKHFALSFKASDGTVTTDTVPYDGDLNYRLNGSEVVTFMPAKCLTVGQFMLDHRGSPLTVVFNGENGKSRQIKLSARQVNAIANAFDYSQAVINGRDLTVERQKLDRQLQIARDQAARMAGE